MESNKSLQLPSTTYQPREVTKSKPREDFRNVGEIGLNGLPVLHESESEGDESEIPAPQNGTLRKIQDEMDHIDRHRVQSTQFSDVSSMASFRSGQSGTSINSLSSAGGLRYPKSSRSRRYRSNASVSSRGSRGTAMSSNDGTEMSLGTSIHSSTASHWTGLSSTPSVAPHRSRRARSPDNGRPMDLFPFTRARLTDVQYRQVQHGENLSNGALRRQMLNVVFGWDEDIDGLIRDELARHEPGSSSAVLLQKWLGDLDPEADMGTGLGNTDTMSSSDWMFLALSNMGGKAASKKLGQQFIQKLLSSGDVHSAAAICLGMGDFNDAVEIYVSHNLHMEAVLLACLLFSKDWVRLSEMVGAWGQYAVDNKEQKLAIRWLVHCIPSLFKKYHLTSQ
jgi:hypothetical protein